MNMFNYSITTHFILSNKDYYSYCNSHSMYQTCLKNEMMAYHKNIGFNLK